MKKGPFSFSLLHFWATTLSWKPHLWIATLIASSGKVPVCFCGILSTHRTCSTSQRAAAMGLSACSARCACTPERWGQGQCTSAAVGSSPGLWGQTGNLGSQGKHVCLAALWQSTKEHVSIAWNREVGSPQNHQSFPLRAGVLLALSFLSLNWRWNLLWMWRGVTVPSQTEFLLQLLVSVTSPLYTLIACLIFGTFSLAERFGLKRQVSTTLNFSNTFTSHNWELTALSVLLV